MRFLIAFLVLMGMATGASMAADGRSISLVPNRTAMLTDSSVGIGASAEAVDFTAATGASAIGALSVCIENNDATNSLLFQLIPTGTSVAASELATPANATLTQVQRLDPSTAAEPVPCFEGNFAGLVWQSLGPSAVSATVRIAY